MLDICNFSIQVPDSAGTKKILSNCNIRVRGGEVVALMGPSGAGKSTLIAAITTAGKGRKQWIVDGDILLNGITMKGMKDAKKLIGFVPQDSIYHARLTANQEIRYKAALRSTLNNVELRERVKVIETLLKIKDCSDVQMGRGSRKGVSGGELKRVMIASELIVKPPILVLDEPTTGLDSYNASVLVDALKELAANFNTAVLITLHQPSYDLFKQFDRVYFASEGEIVINCPPSELPTRFQRGGMEFPEGENIANFAIDCCIDTTLRGQLIEKNDIFCDPITLTRKKVVSEHSDDSSNIQTEFGLIESQERPGTWQVFKALTNRHMIARSRLVLGKTFFGLNLFLGVMCTLVWTNTFANPHKSHDHAGLIFFFMLHESFESYHLNLGDTTEERDIIITELETSMYSPWLSIYARAGPELVILLVGPFMVYTIIGFGTGLFLNQDYSSTAVLGYLVVILQAMWCAAFMRMFQTIFRKVRNGVVIGDVSLTLSLFLAGFYMPVSEMGSFVQGLRWILPMSNFYELYLRVTLGGKLYIDELGNEVQGVAALKIYGFGDIPLWWSILYIFLSVMIFDLVAISCTKYWRVLNK